MGFLFENLKNITVYFTAVNVILFLIGFARNSKAYQVITIYLFMMSGIGLAMHILKYYFEVKNNLYFFVYFIIIQFVLISVFYYKLLRIQWIKWLSLLVLLSLAYQYASDQSLHLKYNPIGAMVTQGVLIIYCVAYFYKSLSIKLPFRIFTIGLLLYLAASTMVFVSGNLAFTDILSKEILFLLQSINVTVYAIFQILIFIEWYRNYRWRKS